MNEDFLKEMFAYVQEGGYPKSYDEFVASIKSNKEFQDELFSAVKEEGYGGSRGGFNKLIGVSVEPNFGPEHKEFDKPIREMSPEARAYVLSSKLGIPYDEALGMQVGIPETMSAMAEGDLSWRQPVKDVGTYLGRWADASRKQLGLGGQDMAELGEGDVFSNVIRSPETGIGLMSGLGAGQILKQAGAKGVPFMAGLAVSEGGGDIIGKQSAGIDVTPTEAVSSYGFGALGGLAGPATEKVADVGKRLAKEGLESATSIPSEAIEQATKKGSWDKLSKSVDLMDDLPDDLQEAVNNAKLPEESLNMVKQSLEVMPDIDVKPVVNILAESRPKITTEVNEEAYNRITRQMKRLQDLYGDGKMPADEFFQLRQDLDKAIDWDAFQGGTKQKVEGAFKKAAGYMRKELVDKAPEGYKESMKDISNALEARENVKKILGNTEWKQSKRARTVLNNIGNSTRKEEREFIQAFDDYFNTDFAESAKTAQAARQMGFGQGAFPSAPAVFNPRGTGRGLTGGLEILMSGGTSSPLITTGVTMPALDALKATGQTAGVRQATQQMGEDALFELLGGTTYE